MKVEQVLEQFGLTSKETEIYLACLQLGTDSVLQIAKKADIKRPTTYNVLEDLIDKGLVTRRKLNNKNLYSAENPDKLNKLAQINKNNIEAIIPNLNAIYNVPRGTSKPNIKVYEGIKEVKNLYIELLKKMNREGEMKLISSVHNNKEFNNDLQYYWMDNRMYNKNKIKEIIDIRLLVNKKFRTIKQHLSNTNYQISVLPSTFSIQNCNQIITDNKIVLINVDKQVSATFIENTNIYNHYSSLFKIIWSTCKEI